MKRWESSERGDVEPHDIVKKILGLIGHQVGYSLSPQMHNTAADLLGLPYFYTVFQVHPPENLRIALEGARALDIAGFNVTIPYKERVLKYLDSLSAEAAEVQAVNTILNRDGQLIGYNTDISGFAEPLLAHKNRLSGESVAIFGSGGATRAAIQALKQYFKPARICLVARNESRAHAIREDFRRRSKSVKISIHGIDDADLADMLSECRLIVNATPVGTEQPTPAAKTAMPETLLPPDSTIWSRDKIAYDLVYRPMQTPFLKAAADAGATTIGGLDMLLAQGAKAFELWTGKKMPIDQVRNVLLRDLSEPPQR